MTRLLPILAFVAISLFFTSYVRAQNAPLSYSTQGQGIVVNIPSDLSSGEIFNGNLEIYKDPNSSTYIVYMNKAELFDAIASSNKLTHMTVVVNITFDFSEIIKRSLSTYQFIIYFEDGTNSGVITLKSTKEKCRLVKKYGETHPKVQ